MSILKRTFQYIYLFGLSDEKSFLTNQRTIRQMEWDAIEPWIPEGSRFLDVGCGKGHALSLAIGKKNCEAIGVDPFPDKAGVAPELSDLKRNYVIERGICEELPFESNSFDVVYSSHMLEHTSDYDNSLAEMNRVLRPGGVMIMGVPTATMALLRLFTIVLFSSHRNLIEIVRYAFRDENWKLEHPIGSFFLPRSHGNQSKSILFDLTDYRVKKWKARVEKHLKLQQMVMPVLYCYPDFHQLFPPHRNPWFSSSVFFIARKKTVQL